MWPTGVVRHERFLGCVAASDERIEDPHGLCAASVVPASTGSPFPAPEELTVDKRLKGVEPILRVPFFHRESIGLAGNLCAVEGGSGMSMGFEFAYRRWTNKFERSSMHKNILHTAYRCVKVVLHTEIWHAYFPGWYRLLILKL
jgi:hypothetical protein